MEGSAGHILRARHRATVGPSVRGRPAWQVKSCAVTMTTTTRPRRRPAAPARARPATHRWTREQYLHMSDLGWFAGQKVELIDGKIIDMPSPKNLHVMAVENAQDALKRAFGPKYWVRSQSTIDLGPRSVPDPDIAVVPGPRRHDVDYPTTAVLVVEASETTLWLDHNRKLPIYAAADIPEYWIINLVDRQLEVYRAPGPDPARRSRHRYGVTVILKPGDYVTPLAAPKKRIAVAKLLP